jgi:hypothetical protein
MAAAAERWALGDGDAAYNIAPKVRAAVAALEGSAAAARLVGSGPWQWGEERGVYFLRGGFMFTKQGTARWGVSSGNRSELAVFLCGSQHPTHSASLDESGGRAVITFTEVEGRDVTGGGARRAGGLQTSATLLGASPIPPFESDADARAALAAGRFDLMSPGAEAEALAERGGGGRSARLGAAGEGAASVRRRLLGSGPWHVPSVGAIIFLRGGELSDSGRQGGPQARGGWRVEESTEGTPLVRIQMGNDAPKFMQAACWRLHGRKGFDRGVHVDFEWAKPARRCFPTCDEQTQHLSRSSLGRSPLAKKVAGAVWSWGNNRDGLRFTFSNEGVPLLVTPWGHGEWGTVRSRADVLVAEFAHQRRGTPLKPRPVGCTCTASHFYIDVCARTGCRLL